MSGNNVKEQSAGVLHVGIDLGTSRSSVSASNNERHVIDSYVGWPVDMVARKVLKREVLVGRDALDNRPMLDLHRPLEHGLIKEGSERDEQAVRELLRHLLVLAGVTPDTRKSLQVRAVVGVPAEAMRYNKQSVRDAIRGLVDSLMIVSEPFAVAYGIDELVHSMIIDSGAGSTDFCVLSGRYPTEKEQRTLTNAGDWVDQQLSTLLTEKHPEATFSIHMVREWKESFGFVGEAKEPVLVTMPVEGKPTEIDITAEMRAACEGLIPPLAETMVDLLSRIEPEYQARVRQNIVLSGGTALIQGLGGKLQQNLTDVGGGRVRVVKDPIYVGSDGALAIALDAGEADWEKLTE